MTDDDEARRHAQVDEAGRRAVLIADWMTAQGWGADAVETKIALLMALAVVAFDGSGGDLTRLLRVTCDLWDEAIRARHQSVLEAVVGMMHQRAAARAADDADQDDDSDSDDDDPPPH